MMESGVDIDGKVWEGRTSFFLKGVATLTTADFNNRWFLDIHGISGTMHYSNFGSESEEEVLYSLESAIIEAQLRII